MTDELEKYGEGAYISEFVSAGPKNYGFEVTITGQNGEPDKKAYEIKVKGFSMSQAATKQLNYATMKEV